MTHSFQLNSEQEKKFQEILSKSKSKSKTAVICKHLFGRRDRTRLQLTVVDIAFLSSLSNLVDSIKDNIERGNEISKELDELAGLIRDKLDLV